MTNRISVSNPTQPVISVTDEGGVLVTVNYQNSTGGGGGTGDVVGPASSTDNAIARYDGTTGKLIQDSGITIADGATGTLAGSNSGDVTLGASVTDVLAVTGQSISGVDQGSDKLVFWDESANKLTALTAGSGLSISGTTITATATGDVVGPASSTDNALVRFDSTTGKLIQNGQITESDTGDLAAINSLAFDTTPTGSIAAQGEVMWNSDEETLDIQLNSFAQHVGEHVLYHVKNSTGSTIAKGVPVMFAGTNGASGKLLVQPWNGTGPSTYFMGLTAEELLDTEEGFVIAFGKLRGIQTNGGNYGETWADGEIIYVGTTTGSLTKTQPAAPNPHIQVCAVVNAHASNGTLFVRPTLGSNIKDDEGVTITSLSSGQLLVANNAGTVFENKSMSGDATLANTGALTLATVNSNVGSFGSATAAPAVTVNAKGLVTAVSTNTITPAVGSITGLGTGVATALAVNVDTSGAFVVNGGALGTPSSGTLTSCTGLPISTGVSGLGSNVAASLANAMSASGTLAILGANTFTALQTVNLTALGTTPSSGATLTNTTAAAAGAQQVSPSLTWTGQGWKTNATAASQTVNWRSYVLPIQGAANPTSSWKLDFDNGAGSYTQGLTYTPGSSPTLTLGGTGATGTVTLGVDYNGANVSFSSNTLALSAGGSQVFRFADQYVTNPGLTTGSDNGSYYIAISTAAAATARTNANSIGFGREASGTIRWGIDNATTPTDQTIKAHNVTTGTGAALTLAGGKGSVAGGAVVLATSATNGAAVARVTIKASGVVNIAGLPTSSAGLSTGDLWNDTGTLKVA